MTTADLTDWMNENSGPHIRWYVKRLSANDTYATNAHQAGPYIPKKILFDLFPTLNNSDEINPRVEFEFKIDSHNDARKVKAIWYNNKLSGGTRNETRLTNFGGISSPMLDPDNTGSLVVLAFHQSPGQDVSVCHAWICVDEAQADLVEDRIGPVEPGQGRISALTDGEKATHSSLVQTFSSCWLDANEIPKTWFTKFPSGEAIIAKALERKPLRESSIDDRLVKRRDCEYEMFQSIEQAIELSSIHAGFRTLDEFLARAQTILQRRKARSGRSLELHVRKIFIEEGLEEGRDFDHQPETESGKRPDFIFPSRKAYLDPNYPKQRLRMLAVKTTCKDRWRQILDEADRIEKKHLLTLQEGVSVPQFQQMVEAGVQLVVPKSEIGKYPKEVQHRIQTLESFVAAVHPLGK